MPVSQQQQRALLEIWTRSLRNALEALSGEPPEIAVSAESHPPAASVRWWRQRLSYPDGAQIWVGTSEEVCGVLGSRVLRAAGVSESGGDEARATYFEILEQAGSAMAVSLGAGFGKEVRVLAGEEVADQAPPESLQLRLALPGEEPLPLWVAFEGLLEPAGPPPEDLSLVAPGAPAPAGRPIDLLLDVELPVSVSFGRTQLPLKEVLKLTSGSIVELNRPVADPVDVIVNNCVIARGEVVVVEGNYGVRITEIVARRERLRSLD